MTTEELSEVTDHLMAVLMSQQASINVLLDFSRRLVERTGIDLFEGGTVADWFQREKKAQLDAMLLASENKDPATAANLQSIIDQIGMRRKDWPGNS